MTRDDQILAAAEKLFFERSFDGVGVDEIGRVAGTSGSAIYRHFPSKDAILAALLLPAASCANHSGWVCTRGACSDTA